MMVNLYEIEKVTQTFNFHVKETLIRISFGNFTQLTWDNKKGLKQVLQGKVYLNIKFWKWNYSLIITRSLIHFDCKPFNLFELGNLKFNKKCIVPFIVIISFMTPHRRYLSKAFMISYLTSKKVLNEVS